MNAALAPLKEFTDLLSGEKYMYVNVSAIKPVLQHLEDHELAVSNDNSEESELTKDIKGKF